MSMPIDPRLRELDQQSTDDLFTIVAGADALGLADDDDGTPPSNRGRRIVKALLPTIAGLLCHDAGFCRLLLEKPTRVPLELAAIAVDVFAQSDHFAGLPVFALGLLVVREFLENLCEH